MTAEQDRWGLEESPRRRRRTNGAAGDGKPARRTAAETFGPGSPDPSPEWLEEQRAKVDAIEPPELLDVERIPDPRDDPAFEPDTRTDDEWAEFFAEVGRQTIAHRNGAGDGSPTADHSGLEHERPRPVRVADMVAPTGLDEFVINEFLRPNVLGAIAAPAGAGKSQIRKDLEMVASTGRGALVGRYTVPAPMTVLTLDEDNGGAEEYRRDDIYLAHHGLSRDELAGCWRVSWTGLRLETDESQAWLAELVDETHAAGARPCMLLILDPISHMYAVKELREELLPVYQFLRGLLRDRPWLTILLIHHLRKLAQGASSERSLEDLRGGPWGSWLDVAAILAPMGEGRARWTLHKRIAPSNLILEQTPAGPFVFVADSETRERKSSTDDRVMACIDAGATSAEEVVLATGIPKRTVFTAVKRLRQAGLVERDGPYRRTPDRGDS